MLKLAAVLFLGASLYSCGGGTGKAEANEEGFASIQKEMHGEFGESAYYTEVSIVNVEGIGNTVSTTVTKDPSSMKMGEWSYSQGAWTQSAEVTLEISEGSKAEDFMFQLGNNVDLGELGKLVETSKESLTKEKDLKNPRLHMAFVKYPNDGDAEKANYVVMLQPETGGTTFSYYYNLDGGFIEMNY